MLWHCKTDLLIDLHLVDQSGAVLEAYMNMHIYLHKFINYGGIFSSNSYLKRANNLPL